MVRSGYCSPSLTPQPAPLLDDAALGALPAPDEFENMLLAAAMFTN
jgi:hypothetical protein